MVHQDELCVDRVVVGVCGISKSPQKLSLSPRCQMEECSERDRASKTLQKFTPVPGPAVEHFSVETMCLSGTDRPRQTRSDVAHLTHDWPFRACTSR